MVDIICLLYVLLFVYAAVSKLLDYENFRIQLGQSPLLSAFASWISWLVPTIELIIAVLLSIPRFRKTGLFAGLTLMVMFGSYIWIVLHYSSFVPCSCGGILEKMSWNVHLVFNAVFVLLAGLAILLQDGYGTKLNSRRLEIKKMLISSVFGIGIMIALFLSSERVMHHENPFIRRYPQHPLMLTRTRDLKFNSYYFAGSIDGRIYLGNYTDPLRLVSMDSSLKNEQRIKISFGSKKIPFTLVRILIRGDFFYLMDGTVPAIYRGSISDWKITHELKGSPYFNLAVPSDDKHIIFRSNSGENSTNVIGVFSPEETPKVTYNKKFLQKQADGVFDTDGMLMYEEKSDKAVYLYYYRNEFVVSDKSANVIRRRHTIDTNSTAKIKVAYLKNGKEMVMSAPAVMVNHHSALYANLLFVHSEIKGKDESQKLWDQASIIDVYDIEEGSYKMSFAIYGIQDKKLQSFYVTSTHLYALIDNHLVIHELRAILKNEFHFPHNNDLQP